MRLLMTVAVWAGCACLLAHSPPHDSMISPAHAQSKAKEAPAGKSVRRCMGFKQRMGEDLESVDLSLTSRCKFEVVCSLEYQVVCSEDQPDDIETTKRSSTLDFQDRWDLKASASRCEQDWEVQNVRWSCAAIDA